MDKIDLNKIILLLIVIVVLIFLFTMFQEYQKAKAEADRINLASSMAAQYASQPTVVEDTRGWLGGFLSQIPLIGSWY